ncbi:MAG: hypothetical protein WA949_16940 [Phormidesmis sp.]
MTTRCPAMNAWWLAMATQWWGTMARRSAVSAQRLGVILWRQSVGWDCKISIAH